MHATPHPSCTQSLDHYLNLNDFIVAAKEKLPREVFDFIAGGSCDEFTLQRNHAILQKIILNPRVLRSLNPIDTTTRILGHTLKIPLIIAPTAYQKLVHPLGEMAMLGAAKLFETIFIVSMFSSVDYQSLAENSQNLWMQMYFLKDQRINERFVRHIHNLGYKALVVTIDAPVYGKREREKRTPLTFQKNLNFDHLKDLGIPFDDCIKNTRHFADLVDPYRGWDAIERLKNITDLPIILKGILDPRDTEIACTLSHVKGVIVSNHGGRQLDGTLSAFELIEKHRQIAKDSLRLFVDGGVTRGSDIFKACALGADAVLLGKASLFALAANGFQGVLKTLHILEEEFSQTMALCGYDRVKDIQRDSVEWL